MAKDLGLGGGPVAKEPHANGATAQSAEVDASGLVQTLQTHVDDIRSLIQCGICMRPLYEPFTLACGHTFCYSCLASWFFEERANKSCPDCRSPVETQPSPAYLVRSIVHLFTGRAELLGKEETTEGLLNEQQQEAERVNKDKSDTNTGLFQGAFKPRPVIPFPIIDAEDNVMRCPHCSWEIEDNIGCIQCGYRPDVDSEADSNESAQWSEGELNSEMTDYFDEELEDGFEVDMEALEALQFGPNNHTLPWPSFYAEHARSYGGWRTEPRTINISDDDDDDDDDEDEEEEDDYEDAEMDSFIDDDEHGEEDDGSASDRSTVVDSHAPSSQVHYNESQMGSDLPVTQEDDYVDTDEEIEENEHEGGHVDRIDEDQNEDEEEDDEEDDDSSDDDDDEDDDDEDEEPIRAPVAAQRRQPLRPTGPLTRRGATAPRIPSSRQPPTRQRAGWEVPRSQRPSTTGSSAVNTIDISDDSDEDPVAPTRRRGQARGIF